MEISEKRIVLAASHSVIEPLGLLHLSTVVRQEGWEPSIVYSNEPNFRDVEMLVNEIRPKYLGFSAYTGNHKKVYECLDRLRKMPGGPKTIIGGPHASVFPQEALKHAEMVVVGEGFNSLRKILRGEKSSGILTPSELEKFPISDRQYFYKTSPSHGESPVKSIMTRTGCPYSCTYCYNSSTIDKVLCFLPEIERDKIKKVMGSERVFGRSRRSVEEVLGEVDEIMVVSPQTKMLYFQDDVFGEDIEWLRDFSEQFQKRQIPFHAQLRFEYADPKKTHGRERLELMKKAGCTGITFAVESGNEIVRKEILKRYMDEGAMFRAFHELASLDFKVRTEQMLGLPTGATETRSPVNLEADLATLDLNIRLKKETGLPTFAWASTFVPYLGTELGDYCKKHGFYSRSNNDDIPDNFFYRSVLRFPKEWVGNSLSSHSEQWLAEPEQEKYRSQLQLLRDQFDELANSKRGVMLAKDYLKDIDLVDSSALKLIHEMSTKRRRHKYDELYGLDK